MNFLYFIIAFLMVLNLVNLAERMVSICIDN